MKRIELLANENGSIMVVTLIILALTTMLGVAASITTSIELQISGNDKRHTENFYKAEAAAMVGAAAIEEFTSKPELIGLPENEQLDVNDENNWDLDKAAAEAPDDISDDDHDARYLPTLVAHPPGGDAGMLGKKVHVFAIYGRSIRVNPNSNKKLGEVIVEIGYKKWF